MCSDSLLIACVRQNLVFRAIFESVSDDKYFLAAIFKGLLDDKYFFLMIIKVSEFHLQFHEQSYCSYQFLRYQVTDKYESFRHFCQ